LAAAFFDPAPGFFVSLNLKMVTSRPNVKKRLRLPVPADRRLTANPISPIGYFLPEVILLA
jgi:hypothetical protein